jgi:hypothetical protein
MPAPNQSTRGAPASLCATRTGAHRGASPPISPSCRSCCGRPPRAGPAVAIHMDDPSVAISACVAGQGLFQSLAIGLAPLLLRGELVQVLPDWSEELYPLCAYHPSRHRQGLCGFHPGDCCWGVIDIRRENAACVAAQAQPSSFSAKPECHIFVMWLILSSVNCIT